MLTDLQMLQTTNVTVQGVAETETTIPSKPPRRPAIPISSSPTPRPSEKFIEKLSHAAFHSLPMGPLSVSNPPGVQTVQEMKKQLDERMNLNVTDLRTLRGDPTEFQPEGLTGGPSERLHYKPNVFNTEIQLQSMVAGGHISDLQNPTFSPSFGLSRGLGASLEVTCSAARVTR